MRRTGWAAALAAAALALGACTGDDDTAVAPSPSTTSASPSPSPTRELKPVVGERLFGLYPVSSAGVLGFGAAPAPDEGAINPLLDAVGDWLDAHLDALQRDGAGRLDAVTTPALRAAAAPEELAVVTTDLASPEAPVQAARYQIDAYHDGALQWIAAKVDVTHPDGEVTSATLVFGVADDAPQLTFAGPETGSGA